MVHFVCMFLERILQDRTWKFYYRNGASFFFFSDRQVWASSVDPDRTASLKEQSDHGLHCLTFCLYVFGKEL